MIYDLGHIMTKNDDKIADVIYMLFTLNVSYQ